MSDYVARDVLIVARVTEDGQSFEDLGIMERKAGQLIIKCQSYEQVPPSQEALCAQIDELCAEVERGKAEFKKMDVWHSQELKAAMDENAKLRELAAGMYGLLAMFDKVFGNHDMCETPRPLIFGEDKSFKDVMRELGIEVPS